MVPILGDITDKEAMIVKRNGDTDLFAFANLKIIQLRAISKIKRMSAAKGSRGGKWEVLGQIEVGL